MGLFDKFKKKNEVIEDDTKITKEQLKEYEENKDIIAMSNYMLADVRKDDIDNKSIKIPIDTISEVSTLSMSSAEIIKQIMEHNPPTKGKMYRITNLGKNDSLVAVRGGKSFWGSIKKSDGARTMAKFKEVNPSKIASLDPTMLMITAALYNIEKDLGEIKELTKKILTFLESEKESQIETDLELLEKTMVEIRYNGDNERFFLTYYNQVADISRNAHKNIRTYKLELVKELSKAKLFTTDGSMKTLLSEIINTFKYYRLSLYICAFSTYLELFLNGNFKSEYMLQKRDELNKLVDEYNDDFNKTLEYIKKNANKSLKGNVLSGLGTAGNAIGNLVEKIKDSNVDDWIREKSDNLKQSGESIKDNYVTMFEEMRETNTKIFINQIEKLNQLYNQTTEIYLDKENVYLQIH